MSDHEQGRPESNTVDADLLQHRKTALDWRGRQQLHGADWLCHHRRKWVQNPPVALMHKQNLTGKRDFKYPLIALKSEGLTRTARHTLSQRVIAGTMHVHSPFEPDSDQAGDG